jgi:poly(A) polymerase
VSRPTHLARADFLAERRVRRLLAALNPPAGAGETRVVGGAVRNTLLGLPVTDVDCATRLAPEEVMRRARAAGFEPAPTGLPFGTVTVVVEGRGYEVTTLRRDLATDGRRATVVAFGTDWHEDARRRDLTMNALYCDPDGRLYDPVGGYEDALARRVRFIGDPDARLREDYLRVLRFFRFHAQYGAGELDRAGFDACVRARGGIPRLSAERIRQELSKLVLAPGAAAALRALAETGILSDLVGVTDVARLERLAAIEAATGTKPSAPRRLAGLAVRIGEDAERLAARLRLSNAEARVLAAVGAFAAALARDVSASAARRALHRAGPLFADVCLVAWAQSGAAPDDAAWRSALALPQTAPVPPFPLRGADLVAAGVPAGPAVGAAMARAEAAWIASDFTLDRAALLALATT